MSAAQAMPHVTPAHVDDVPEDMCWPDGMQRCSLKQAMEAARSDLHKWQHNNEHRTHRQYGQGSMSPLAYRAGVQARLTTYHTLRDLWRAQQHGGTPQ